MSFPGKSIYDNFCAVFQVEQFALSSPHDDASWQLFDEMIGNAENYCKVLGLPYRVVNIVSGKATLSPSKATLCQVRCYVYHNPCLKEFLGKRKSDNCLVALNTICTLH